MLINYQYLYRCSTISSTDIPETPKVNLFCSLNSDGLLETTSFESAINNPYFDAVARTLDDNTFFSTKDIKAKFDMFDLNCSDIVVTDVGTHHKGKVAKLLLVLGFKDKIVFVRTLHSPDNVHLDTDFGENINFIENWRPPKVEDEEEKKEEKEKEKEEEEKSRNRDIIVLNRIEPLNKNSVKFLNVQDVKIEGDYLFVVDNKLNTLIKYDISQLLHGTTMNQWNVNNIQIVDSIQGSVMNSSVYFKNPSGVAISNDAVYLADRGNNVVKKYTTSLDFIKTLKCGKFATQEIKSITTNPNSFKLEDGTLVESGSVWVLSKTTNHVYITIISNDKVILSKQIHGLTLQDEIFEEDVLKIRFSPSDSNYYYIVTNKRTVKAHASRPTLVFGTIDIFHDSKIVANNVWKKTSFSWGGRVTSIWGMAPDEYLGLQNAYINKCFCVCGCDKSLATQFNGDIVFNVTLSLNKLNASKTIASQKVKTLHDLPNYLKTECLQGCFFLFYTAKHTFRSALSNINYSCYDNDDITEINDSEYIDTITLNKSLYKMAFNLVSFKNLLNGRFWGYYDENGLMKHDKIVQDSIFKSIKVDSSNDSKNFFVHANEPNTIIINRTFECIWNIQNQICRFLNVVHKTASTTNSQVHTIIE